MNEKLLNSLSIDKLRDYLVCEIEYSYELRERIDKAIEYINEQQSFVYGIRENGEFLWKDTETKKDLLKILRGAND